jgi:3-hydroxyisobutyrate dehydrogenase
MSLIDENPNTIYENIKELLIIGAKDRKHSFHTPIFSNSGTNNRSNSRIIVLRKFDHAKLSLIFNTDYRSPKITDLQKNNLSNFVFYDANIKIQLRVKTISKIHYNNHFTSQSWEKTRLFSRKCYLTQKAPSSITDKPEDGIPEYLKGIDPNKNESEIGYLNFSVIENFIQEIDWLFLASSGHRRLKITFKDNSPFFEWIIP